MGSEDTTSKLYIVLVWCFAALMVKLMALAFNIGFQRSRSNTYATPEDARLAAARKGTGEYASLTHDNEAAGTVQQAGGEEPPELARAIRMHNNDLENAPLFIGAAMCFVFAVSVANVQEAVSVTASLWVGAVLLCAYVFLRYVYTFCYYMELQPWRSLCFLGGQLLLAGLMGYSLVISL
eukprot:CAMPEP_0174238450 /NCGR_PEP_ID=MMETSP0417-20130205/11256_1 /TAXON_ID=242541 /ORGANISM="Mayorella sp, Strain BSH-02190019" /LENGTH=179 /DNA_ID=CAMNT_0015317287 /DNA_START=58 /DNA_END=594 /DNA_ORIENTATION=-